MEPKVCPMRQVVFFNLFQNTTMMVVSSEFLTVYGKQVVSEMREIVSKDNQNLTSNSFLLDDDLRYTTFSHWSSFHLLAVLSCDCWMNQNEWFPLLLDISGQFLLELDFCSVSSYWNWNYRTTKQWHFYFYFFFKKKVLLVFWPVILLWDEAKSICQAACPY